MTTMQPKNKTKQSCVIVAHKHYTISNRNNEKPIIYTNNWNFKNQYTVMQTIAKTKKFIEIEHGY